MAKDNDVPGDVNQEIDFINKYYNLCEGHTFTREGKKIFGCAKASHQIKDMKQKSRPRRIIQNLLNAADEEFKKIRFDENG